MTKKPHPENPSITLEDNSITIQSFPNLQTVFAAFEEHKFKQESARKRFHRVNQALLQLILEAPPHSFLLPAIIEFIEQIQEKNIIDEKYHISFFEFWLNHFSEVPEEQNYAIRGKIVGKYIPRDDYQAFFPIGMNQIFSGTHFVAAHLSPDVDTMVASFWGWIDAFAARVGDARHIWNLPGGPPISPVTQVFQQTFGSGIFKYLASVNTHLSLSAIDLVTHKSFLKKKGDASINSLDVNSSEKALVLVDEDGHFLGDWTHMDIEPIRKIIIRFKSCLRWFENNLHVKLISLFAKKELHRNDISSFLSSVFDVQISDCEPVKEFTERQKQELNDFFHKVLGLKKGLQGTFRELNSALAKLSVYDLIRFQEEVEALQQSDLFDDAGKLKEIRPLIFNRLEKIINQLDSAIHQVRDYAEHLGVALNIKSKVFGLPSQFITTRNDVEDIRIKMGKREYLTVVIPEGVGKLFPIGVIWAHTVNKPTLGTVSFRDFCNQEEVKMAPYLSPISVVDHHKSSLKTSSAPSALIGDAQSCNVIIAEQTFRINDHYSTSGMSLEDIDKQIKDLQHTPSTLSKSRMLQRLFKHHMAAQTSGKFYVHPYRELAEYFTFLHAILDDTDLLTKVSKRDVECVKELLNRIKSLMKKKEIEVVNFDGIPSDKQFANEAAKRLLQNHEMYSIYRQIYDSKEQEVEYNLQAAEDDQMAALFLDTKEQNGCCRVGQTKLFSSNFPSFAKNSPKLMEYWLKHAEQRVEAEPQIDLHLHMISTIASAQEVYEDKVGHYKHQDQLWFWVPPKPKAYDHLTNFLTAFLTAQKLGKANFQFLNGVSEEIQQIFIRNSMGIPTQKMAASAKLPLVVLQFPAGTLNSRKAMITPYLPKII